MPVAAQLPGKGPLAEPFTTRRSLLVDGARITEQPWSWLRAAATYGNFARPPDICC